MSLITIKGDTVEQKFKHVERILQRFSRRLHKTIIGLIPASPIFGYCSDSKEDPNVLRAIFPVEGVITHAALKANRCGKDARMIAELTSGDDKVTKSFRLRPRASVQKIDFPVLEGDSLDVRVIDDSEKGSLGVKVGLLYQIGTKDLASTKFLVDQFEALIEGGRDVEED